MQPHSKHVQKPLNNHYDLPVWPSPPTIMSYGTLLNSPNSRSRPSQKLNSLGLSFPSYKVGVLWPMALNSLVTPSHIGSLLGSLPPTLLLLTRP